MRVTYTDSTDDNICVAQEEILPANPRSCREYEVFVAFECMHREPILNDKFVLHILLQCSWSMARWGEGLESGEPRGGGRGSFGQR